MLHVLHAIACSSWQPPYPHLYFLFPLESLQQYHHCSSTYLSRNPASKRGWSYFNTRVFQSLRIQAMSTLKTFPGRVTIHSLPLMLRTASPCDCNKLWTDFSWREWERYFTRHSFLSPQLTWSFSWSFDICEESNGHKKKSYVDDISLVIPSLQE